MLCLALSSARYPIARGRILPHNAPYPGARLARRGDVFARDGRHAIVWWCPVAATAPILLLPIREQRAPYHRGDVLLTDLADMLALGCGGRDLMVRCAHPVRRPLGALGVEPGERAEGETAGSGKSRPRRRTRGTGAAAGDDGSAAPAASASSSSEQGSSEGGASKPRRRRRRGGANRGGGSESAA